MRFSVCRRSHFANIYYIIIIIIIHSLGNMYMNGQAVEQSNKLALQFFQMGAKKGKINYTSKTHQSNSWGKHKANRYHDGEFIPDKTYWLQKDFI